MTGTGPSQKKNRPRSTKKAMVKGSGAVAQGKGAKAAGKRAVIIGGRNTAPINTGDIYPTFIQQANRPGATVADLRNGYLAWLSMRANELPLLAGDSGKPVQLSSVYTALLTESRDPSEAHLSDEVRVLFALSRGEAPRQSALEALDRVTR